MKKIDRRINKTKTAIIEAFFELLQKNSYDNVTVMEIVDLADVGRTTFYSHFPTKDDLLTESMSFLFNRIIEIDEYKQKDNIDDLIPLKNILEHTKQHNQKIKAALLSDAGLEFFNKAKRYWIKIVSEHLQMNNHEEESLISLKANLLADVTISIIKFQMVNSTIVSQDDAIMLWKNIIDKISVCPINNNLDNNNFMD